jgi:predicted permease
MDTIWQDARYGVRMLFKNPAFTAIAVTVLALGIGANTAIFSLVNVFLLRPLPVERPGELLSCFNKNTKNPNSYRAFSYPNYTDLRDRNTTFSSLLAHNLAMVGITEGDNTRRVFADVVTANYFDTFGARLTRGRAFSPAEETPGSGIPVVIVSHRYWKSRGSDPNLVGRTLKINGQIYTIIGVAPEEFTGTTAIFSPEVWLPLGMHDRVLNDFMENKRALAARDNSCLFVVGRLKTGMSPERADAELAVSASQLEKAFPAENKDYTVIARPLTRVSTSTNPQDDSELTTTSVLLLSMAAVVLLIACLNLANMLLARATARRKEFAIRLALGGGRGRLLRQLLIEGMILSLLGGSAGLLLAYWGTSVLVSSMEAMIPLQIIFHSGPDLRVLAALMGFCVVSTLVSGIGPALKASRPDVVGDLKEHAGEDSRGKRRRWLARRNVLVVAQMSLSLALLTAAGLFIRSALRAGDANPGFSMEGGLILEVDPGLAGYNETRGRETYRNLLEKLRSVPGVESASMAVSVPYGILSLGKDVYKAGDLPQGKSADPQAEGKHVGARYNVVGEDYFRTVGLTVLRGRAFSRSEAELNSGSRVAVIDESLARRLWPNEDALGKQVQFGGEEGEKGPKEIEVVGIVSPVKYNLFEKTPPPFVYVPFGQKYQSGMNVHLKISASGKQAEASLIQSVRREVRMFDEQLPVIGLKTLQGHLDTSIEVWMVRTGAMLFTVFGAVALFLSVVGVYGVKAYTVARRTREIGIRMALGATSGNTLWLVLREGLTLTAVGVAIGLALGLGIGRLLSNMLFEVSAADPLIFISAPLMLTGVALIACYIPARRAAKINPITALRYE